LLHRHVRGAEVGEAESHSCDAEEGAWGLATFMLFLPSLLSLWLLWLLRRSEHKVKADGKQTERVQRDEPWQVDSREECGHGVFGG